MNCTTKLTTFEPRKRHGFRKWAAVFIGLGADRVLQMKQIAVISGYSTRSRFLLNHTMHYIILYYVDVCV